jgi:hypothetical protein
MTTGRDERDGRLLVDGEVGQESIVSRMLAYKTKRVKYYIYRSPIVRAASRAPFSIRMPPAVPDTAAPSLPDSTIAAVRLLAMACCDD